MIGCRPLVLTGVTHDWPAMQRWLLQDTKARFGHLEVAIQAERSADLKCEQNKLDHRRSANLGEFVDPVLNGGATNDYYLTVNNEALWRPDFARFPLFRDVKVLEVIAEPDDTVFLPLGGCHQVTALDTSLSFSHSNLALPNRYSYLNPEIRNG